MTKYFSLILIPVFVIFSSCCKKKEAQVVEVGIIQEADVWEHDYIEDDDYDIIYENSSFAFKLFHQINDPKKNTIFSPFSISSALAMTYAGAKTETEREMSKTLHFSLSQPQVHKGFKNLMNNLYSIDPDAGTELKIANSLWAQEKYGILDSYYKVCQKYYGSGVKYLDFKNKPEKSRIQINDWVEENTNDKITNLIPENAISDLTRLVLTNAIWFYGKWMIPFDKKHTETAPFYLENGSSVQAKFMNHPKERFLHYKDSSVQIVELPYEGKKNAMMVFLPAEGKSINDFGKELNYEYFNAHKRLMKASAMEVLLPRFSFTYSISLEKHLSDMGMPLAFSDLADFSGMTGKRDLKIDKIIHKAFVEVNEEGTEAAGATAVIMVERTSFPPEKKVFNANRPFAFVIYDKENGSILFIGKVMNPVK
ncbi:MAG: serpin family protein [Bacteroidetes bacterium]|nr:serpin family protein [Bacteroidota bacterium]